MVQAVTKYSASDGKLFDSETEAKAYDYMKGEAGAPIREFAERTYESKAQRTKAVNIIAAWESQKNAADI